MFSSRLAAGTAGLLLISAGIWQGYQRRAEAKRQAAEPRRLAVLPVDNQAPAEPWEDYAAALPRLVALQLEGIRDFAVVQVASAAEAASQRASHLLHAAIESRAGKPVLVLTFERLEKQRIEETSECDLQEGDWRACLDFGPLLVRRRLALPAPEAPVPLPASRAVRPLASGLAALNRGAVSEAGDFLRQSLTVDSNCGWCWVAWAETQSRLHGREGMREVAGRFAESGRNVDAASAAKLALLSAVAEGDQPGQRKAIDSLARLRPSDAGVQLALSQAAQLGRDYATAERALQAAIRLSPAQAEHWNTLGYLQAYQGKLDDALRSIAEYEKQAPESPNPLDSRGEVLWMAGRFQEAEKAFLAVHKKDPNFQAGVALEKAALCRWMAGDSEGASAIAGRYLQERAGKKDPLTRFHQARWDWLAGRRSEALLGWRALASSQQPAAPVAAARLAVALLELGEKAEASRWAAVAARNPVGPAGRAAAGFAAALTAPEGRVEAPKVWLALRLSLEGRFREAMPVWKEALDATPGGAEQAIRVLAAWNALRAGDAKSAANLAPLQWPVLSTEQSLWLDSLVLQNLLFVRGELARAANHSSEAQRYLDLYLRTMGTAEDRFGQVAQARGQARL